MADQEQDIPKYDPDDDNKSGGTATKSPPKSDKKSSPKKRPPGMLPPWKVLLHNDDSNDIEYVIDTVLGLTPLKEQEATLRTIEAHKQGVALLLVTHKERAELYEDQFKSKGLTVSIEPAE
ncbi:MAG: ATP-dependent Clp protease adaptor ClpS [Planctomycetota bacterium]